MNDKQNLEFMNHPDLVAAQKRLENAKERVRDVQTSGPAQVILTLMPPAMKELAAAYEDLKLTEARLEYEITARAAKEDPDGKADV